MEVCEKHPHCTRRVMLAGNVMCWLCYQKIPHKLKLEAEKKFVCEECGNKLLNDDPYHIQWRTCDQTCYMHLVGMSWSDFM